MTMEMQGGTQVSSTAEMKRAVLSNAAGPLLRHVSMPAS